MWINNCLPCTIATITRRDVRKVVNKVFAVTVGDFDTYWEIFAIAISRVKIDCTVDHSLLRGRMSPKEPSAMMHSARSVNSSSLLDYLGPSLTANAVPTRPLPVWRCIAFSFCVTTRYIVAIFLSSIFMVSEWGVKHVVVGALLRTWYQRNE